MPTDIGEVSLAVRSMLRNRSGRPRSWTSANPLTPSAATAVKRQLRRSAVRPVRSAPNASSDEPAASPPENR